MSCKAITICRVWNSPNSQKLKSGYGVRVSGGHLCRRQKHRPSRQARPAAFAVHQTAPQNPLHQSTDKLQTHRIPRRHRRSGRGNVLSVGKTTRRKRRRNRTAKSRQSNAVGAEDEQYS